MTRLINTLNALCVVSASVGVGCHHRTGSKPQPTVSPLTQIEAARSAVIEEFDAILASYVDKDGFFDQVGALDVAVWKRRAGSDDVVRVYESSLGKAQNMRLRDASADFDGTDFLESLQALTTQAQPLVPDVDARIEHRHRYRIASNTKTFVGLAAARFEAMYPTFDLDMKVSPRFIDLSKLGMAHGWNGPTASRGYSAESAPARTYVEGITFRHLLMHRSGLSREAKRDDMYRYGSSRTHTPLCPTSDAFNTGIACTVGSNERPWRPWAEHIIPYMMPACGYRHYPEMSAQTTCLPGEYFHYSNAGYALAAYALDAFLKQEVDGDLSLEAWIHEHIFEAVGMPSTVFSWGNDDRAGRRAAAHGCYGGENRASCDFARAFTDFADRGLKTAPGGVWSTTADLAKYLLSLHRVPQAAEVVAALGDPPRRDAQSEEDPQHMPPQLFQYGLGWYVAPAYSCTLNPDDREFFQGAWGSVPGYTSYMMTNARPAPGEDQIAVVMLRSYNHAARFNLGNQTRRLLWRLLHPERPESSLQCPVVQQDLQANLDKLL